MTPATTPAAIACNKAQAIVGALLRQDQRLVDIAAKLSEAGDRLNGTMRAALQLHQGGPAMKAPTLPRFWTTPCLAGEWDEQRKDYNVSCDAETLEHIQHAIDNTAEMLDAGLESLGWMIWHVGAAESAKDGPNLGIDSGQLANLGWLLMELTRARGVLAFHDHNLRGAVAVGEPKPPAA